MALKLTKNKTIILTSIIVVLSVALGFLVWRVNQPQELDPTESEASEYDTQCVGADFIFSLEKRVCAPGFSDQDACPPHRTLSVNVTGIPAGKTARYQVKGVVLREFPEIETQCQNNEIFHLEINGVKGRVSKDNTNCNMNSQFEDLSPSDSASPYFTFNPGSNTVHMYTDSNSVKGDPNFPDSVYLANVCLYAVNECGDGVVEFEEECEPEFTITGEAGSCEEGKFCNDSCKCEANPPSCGDGKIDPIEPCDYKATPNGCSNNYTCNTSCNCEAPLPVCGDGVKNGTEACDYKATPTGCATNYTCNTSCTCDAPLPTCGDGVLSPNIEEECENGDPSGVQCAWSACNHSTCKCLPAGLNISKTVVESCIAEGTENPSSQLVYTITVRNTGSGKGQISKIEDVLDSKVLAKGITPTDIVGGGVYSSGKIVWSFSPALDIASGATQTYSYKLVIDKNSFGTYANTVTLTPVSGDTIQANASIKADCVVTVPKTGIFDSTLGRISVGFVLLLIGGVVYNLPSEMFMPKVKKNRFKYRIRFESRVSNK